MPTRSESSPTRCRKPRCGRAASRALVGGHLLLGGRSGTHRASAAPLPGGWRVAPSRSSGPARSGPGGPSPCHCARLAAGHRVTGSPVQATSLSPGLPPARPTEPPSAPPSPGRRLRSGPGCGGPACLPLDARSARVHGSSREVDVAARRGSARPSGTSPSELPSRRIRQERRRSPRRTA